MRVKLSRSETGAVLILLLLGNALANPCSRIACSCRDRRHIQCVGPSTISARAFARAVIVHLVETADFRDRIFSRSFLGELAEIFTSLKSVRVEGGPCKYILEWLGRVPYTIIHNCYIGITEMAVFTTTPLLEYSPSTPAESSTELSVVAPHLTTQRESDLATTSADLLLTYLNSTENEEFEISTVAVSQIRDSTHKVYIENDTSALSVTTPTSVSDLAISTPITELSVLRDSAVNQTISASENTSGIALDSLEVQRASHEITEEGASVDLSDILPPTLSGAFLALCLLAWLVKKFCCRRESIQESVTSLADPENPPAREPAPCGSRDPDNLAGDVSPDPALGQVAIAAHVSAALTLAGEIDNTIAGNLSQQKDSVEMDVRGDDTAALITGHASNNEEDGDPIQTTEIGLQISLSSGTDSTFVSGEEQDNDSAEMVDVGLQISIPSDVDSVSLSSDNFDPDSSQTELKTAPILSDVSLYVEEEDRFACTTPVPAFCDSLISDDLSTEELPVGTSTPNQTVNHDFACTVPVEDVGNSLISEDISFDKLAGTDQDNVTTSGRLAPDTYRGAAFLEKDETAATPKRKPGRPRKSDQAARPASWGLPKLHNTRSRPLPQPLESGLPPKTRAKKKKPAAMSSCRPQDPGNYDGESSDDDHKRQPFVKSSKIPLPPKSSQ